MTNLAFFFLLASIGCLNCFGFFPERLIGAGAHKSRTKGGLTSSITRISSVHHPHYYRHNAVSKKHLQVGGGSQDEPAERVATAAVSINPLALAGWLGLVAWAVWGPGSFNSPIDARLLQNIIANPTSPAGVNELFYFLFNAFVVVPFLFASLILPQQPRVPGGDGGGLPATPFLFLSAFVGFFAIGPYLAFRPPPPTQPCELSQELGWYTRNIAENRIVSAVLLAILVYLPIATGLLPALQQNPNEVWYGFVDLLSTSKFVSVSTVDLSLIHLASVALIPRDYLLRNSAATIEEAKKIALAAFFLPFLGPLVYLVWRPSLTRGN